MTGYGSGGDGSSPWAAPPGINPGDLATTELPVVAPFTPPVAPVRRRPVGLWLAGAGLTVAVAAGAVVAVKLVGSHDSTPTPAAAQQGNPSAAASQSDFAGEIPTGGDRDTASQAVPAELKPGAKLSSGQALRSPNGKYTLTQQPDGNLVLADDQKRVQWSSQTSSNPGATASFDRNGDLVVYGKGGLALWRSATGGQGALLEVHDDGNAVVSRTDRQEAWSSRAERTRLYPGQGLTSGQQRRTADGKFTLTQQPDGNLVVAGADKKVVWTAQTGGHQGGYTLMQPDGNLVVYSADKQPQWSSGTFGSTGAAAVLGDGGNLVVTAGGKTVWSTATDGISRLTVGQRLHAGQSRTSPKGGFTLLMQPDGNLVLQNAAKTVVWKSVTSGHPGASVMLQGDGNLVVYDSANKALWSTKTTGKATAYLQVEDAGAAVLYTAAKQSVWTSKTA
ncbi:hypothetical protein ABT369_48100 [Dactylosporangium sp. NPDC000244]|uniref:hypothetical protein n=1 Tax=Dactylosporangium sp. NPDC000244 TaxID=3154365 RepID=UPI00332F270B